MERRRSKRITMSMRAERISGGLSHPVFIENISEHGIYFITPDAGTAKKFHPGAALDLKFRLNSGETILLNCKVMWSYARTMQDGLTDSVGLEIIDPPSGYMKFVSSLY